MGLAAARPPTDRCITGLATDGALQSSDEVVFEINTQCNQDDLFIYLEALNIAADMTDFIEEQQAAPTGKECDRICKKMERACLKRGKGELQEKKSFLSSVSKMDFKVCASSDKPQLCKDEVRQDGRDLRSDAGDSRESFSNACKGSGGRLERACSLLCMDGQSFAEACHDFLFPGEERPIDEDRN